MDIETAFGLVLRRIRNEKGFSQEELSDLSGFHRTYLSLLERGRKTPSLDTCERLSKALGLQMHDFVLLIEEEMIKSNDVFQEETT